MAIDKFSFELTSVEDVRRIEHNGNKVGENWPVVYVLNNDEEAYVGETVNAARRMEQHLLNPAKNQLTDIRIISEEDYNKSVILDLESYLIKHMSADNKYRLLNGNNGIQDHEYYQRSKYEERFRQIWQDLMSHGLVSQSIEDIENSELFKYSPYKSLGDDQKEAEVMILQALSDCQKSGEDATILVNGGAGTGKTILAIYLIKLIADINQKTDIAKDFIDEDSESVFATECLTNIKKIGIVLPQSSLRTSVKKVFSTIESLNKDMVYSTYKLVDEYLDSSEQFDLVIVDEAHRLKCRDRGNRSLQDNLKMTKYNSKLGLDELCGTELDWILKCSKNAILFRDDRQRVRLCDIDGERFNKIISEHTNESTLIRLNLNTQWRCLGGIEYTSYVSNILNCTQNEYHSFDNYEFKIFDDVDQMVNAVKELDNKYGLCRNVAGYDWKWESKNNPQAYDINIGDYQYRWNQTSDEWIDSKTSINEIGCIHTVQGYDLNYTGVIIGPDLKYDNERNAIFADPNEYKDTLGRSGLTNNPDELLKHLRNIYQTLMTRGIRGTYVYVCDDALREYMKQFIN